MKNIIIEVRKKIELNQDVVDDLIVTALEGGINYWCGEAYCTDEKWREDDDCKYLSGVISRGYGIMLVDREDDTERWELTLDKFKKGIEMWIENECGGYWSGDPGEIDGDAIDLIIQYAVMGRIIFG